MLGAGAVGGFLEGDLVACDVDYAQQVRRVLRTALSAEGYTVFEAGTGEEALNLFRASPPEAVLLDVNMPGMTGLDLQEELKRRGHKVPIIFITAQRDINIREQAFRQGAAQFLYKPFSGAALFEALKETLK